MKAMILAAGLGTRLRPITDTRPKALVEVLGRPLLAWVIDRLAGFGFRDIIVNAHYLVDQIVEFAAEYPKESGIEGLRLTVSREEDLLGTGGALKHAAWFFDDEPFLLHNADVISDLDLAGLMARHRDSQSLATLAVKTRETKRFLLFDGGVDLCGWQRSDPPETRMVKSPANTPEPFPFMCVQAISPGLFDHMPDQEPFSLIDLYLRAVGEGGSVNSYVAQEAKWMDVGRLEQLGQVAGYFGGEYFESVTAGKRKARV